MNRKGLLIADMKATMKIMRIAINHEKKFAPPQQENVNATSNQPQPPPQQVDTVQRDDNG